MKYFLNNINVILERRQTMLFSATQTEKTKNLTSLALKKEPVYVGVDDHRETATVAGLEQGYFISYFRLIKLMH